MKISFDRCLITSAALSSKTAGLVYMDLVADTGNFSFSTRQMTLTEVEKLKLLPISLEATVRGRRYQQNQNLSLEQVTIKVLK